MTKQSSLDTLPSYLRRYCSTQDYAKYTSRDHAAWRFIMRQSRDFFRNNAVTIYLDGLKKTGIPLDRIPKVSEMDAALQEFGWGAVPVCGFIPPIAFLDLQARGILPIATDMRTVEHIAYTPAPDIVHEAAGHAPIIADPAYRNYLRKYASIAEKTIMSSEDLALYEAIRVLSDIKENPDTKPHEIEAAQKALDATAKNISYVSEATKVSRMAWWTVEYGLMGDIKNPKIYGAGLLSSIGESKNCLSSNIRKIPLSIKCVDMTYDITEPQPQLFVAENMDHLTNVLMELEGDLSFKNGGIQGLEEAKKAKTVNTVQIDSGLQMSGKLVNYEVTGAGRDQGIQFVKFEGASQLAWNNKELAGQGKSRHAHGFSTPLGRWAANPSKSPGQFVESDLVKIGIQKGNRTTLEFVNGITVQGVVQDVAYHDKKVLYITWVDCTVQKGAKVYFEPAWGEFDMPVGEHVTSVFGGPADRGMYGVYEMGGVSTQPGRTSLYTSEELKLFECYGKIIDLRKNFTPDAYESVANNIFSAHKDEWLLLLEVLEISKQKNISSALEKKVFEMLTSNQTSGDRELIDWGLRIAGESD